MKVDINTRYEQLAEDFRSLNQLFWRIPAIAMTVNGGVGVAVGSLNITESMQTVLFLFLVMCNIGFILITLRIRVHVMERLLSQMREMEGNKIASGSFSIAYIFAVFFIIAGLFSGWAAFNTPMLLNKKGKESAVPLCIFCIVDKST